MKEKSAPSRIDGPAALNYAEAQSAESRKDFIHKTSIVLKELRESHVNLKIIVETGICSDQKRLIEIFHVTVHTARKNNEM